MSLSPASDRGHSVEEAIDSEDEVIMREQIKKSPRWLLPRTPFSGKPIDTMELEAFNPRSAATLNALSVTALRRCIHAGHSGALACRLRLHTSMASCVGLAARFPNRLSVGLRH
eukprot:gene10025-1808_t